MSKIYNIDIDRDIYVTGSVSQQMLDYSRLRHLRAQSAVYEAFSRLSDVQLGMYSPDDGIITKIVTFGFRVTILMVPGFFVVIQLDPTDEGASEDVFGSGLFVNKIGSRFRVVPFSANDSMAILVISDADGWIVDTETVICFSNSEVKHIIETTFQEEFTMSEYDHDLPVEVFSHKLFDDVELRLNSDLKSDSSEDEAYIIDLTLGQPAFEFFSPALTADAFDPVLPIESEVWSMTDCGVDQILSRARSNDNVVSCSAPSVNYPYLSGNVDMALAVEMPTDPLFVAYLNALSIWVVADTNDQLVNAALSVELHDNSIRNHFFRGSPRLHQSGISSKISTASLQWLATDAFDTVSPFDSYFLSSDPNGYYFFENDLSRRSLLEVDMMLQRSANIFWKGKQEEIDECSEYDLSSAVQYGSTAVLTPIRQGTLDPMKGIVVEVASLNKFPELEISRLRFNED